MIRLLKIALREYLAYVRTVGFWLSMCAMPLGFILAFGAPAMLERSAPPPRLAVIDLTGKDYAATVAQAVRTPHVGRRGGPPRPEAAVAAPRIGPVADAAEAGRRLAPRFERTAPDRLDAAAVIHPDNKGVAVDFWSRNLVDRSLEQRVRDAVGERMRRDRLAALGLSSGQIGEVDGLAPRVTSFAPQGQGRRAALRDRLPGLLGFGLGMLLWSMIFTGAGILLNSVIEEKSNRVLEVLLASASIPEIMGGKILGVAWVTATVLMVWSGIGAGVLAVTAPQIAGDVGAVLMGKGLIVWFAVFLIGGYLMYACVFTAIGAHCETTREAQTLLAPIMMISTIPVIFMSQAITRPDTPALAVLSWIPPFTPFLMPARAAADPPLWQVLAAAVLTAATAALSAWLSVKAFRAGALSGGRSDPRPLIARVLRPGAR
jgi:ABC-2 type transport system permease protein